MIVIPIRKILSRTLYVLLDSSVDPSKNQVKSTTCSTKLTEGISHHTKECVSEESIYAKRKGNSNAGSEYKAMYPYLPCRT